MGRVGRIHSKPNGIRIESAYMQRIIIIIIIDEKNVAHLTLRDLPTCLQAGIAARRFDKAAEVSRGHRHPLHRRGNPAF